jgi:ribose 5-phosphate isomerase B
MMIAIGADHRGASLLGPVAESIREMGHDVAVFGTAEPCSVDYPDLAIPVATRVSTGEADRGVLICGTGIGMSICANKIDGIRAAVITDETTAQIARLHNDTNVMCLGAEMLPIPVLCRVLRVWLETPFEGGRHARRLDKIASLERGTRVGAGDGEGAAIPLAGRSHLPGEAAG